MEETNNLSAQVRSNEFFDNLILKNNELKKNYDKWLYGYTTTNRAGKKIYIKPKTGPEPRIPFLYKNTGEARKYAGGEGGDFKMIGGAAAQAAQAIKKDKWVDLAGPLKQIDENRRITMSKAGKEVDEILNPLNGKVALRDYAQSFMDAQNSAKGIPTQLYNNLVLYPKGMSQMAKTILAPFTHVETL